MLLQDTYDLVNICTRVKPTTLILPLESIDKPLKRAYLVKESTLKVFLVWRQIHCNILAQFHSISQHFRIKQSLKRYKLAAVNRTHYFVKIFNETIIRRKANCYLCVIVYIEKFSKVYERRFGKNLCIF